MGTDELGEPFDFNDAYRAFNNGDHDRVERFLDAVAPPPRDMVEALERRINKALRQYAMAHSLPPTTGVIARPREHRAASRTRAARAPDDGPERPRRPLTGRERSYLKQLIDGAVRARLATRKVCACCDLDLPREAFRPARRTCTDCEVTARIKRRRMVAA